MEWRLISRVETPVSDGDGSVRFYTVVRKQATWPQDGSQYAGRTYEDKTVWVSTCPGYPHVVVHHSQYPAKEEAR